MKAFDWLTRAAMLVFAGLATLSMIAAIAAIPSGGLGIAGQPSTSRGDAAVADGISVSRPTDTMQAPGVGNSSGAGEFVLAPDVESDAAEAWRESLGYTLFAIAGFCAAILVVLLRISAQISSLMQRDRL